MEVKIVILFFFSLFFGCNNKEIPKNKISQTKIDTLPSEAFAENKLIGEDKYIIEWGTSKFTNISKGTFEILGSGSLVISETSSNSKYILLNQPCGSGCSRDVILPLFQNSRELDFWNVVYVNIKQEIIITTKNSGNGEFVLTNFGINKQKDIVIVDMCPAADKALCIDSIFVKNKELYFQYQGSKWEANKPDPKLYKVKLD